MNAAGAGLLFLGGSAVCLAVGLVLLFAALVRRKRRSAAPGQDASFETAATVAPTSSAPSTASPAPSARACDRCGAAVPSEGRFCPACGSPACPSCGRFSDAGATFCAYCGTRMT